MFFPKGGENIDFDSPIRPYLRDDTRNPVSKFYFLMTFERMFYFIVGPKSKIGHSSCLQLIVSFL
jgi:hypothetical protein